MTRPLLWLLGLLLVLWLVISGLWSPAEATHRKCGRIKVTTRKTNARFIRCVARHVGVSPDEAVRVARCESDLRWWLVDSVHGGTFQQNRDYWPGRVRAYLNPRAAKKTLARKYRGITNAKANARVSLRMAAAEGWGHWPWCGR